MSAGTSTFIVLLVWAAPIVIGLILMQMYYRSPPAAELAIADEVQPD